MNNFCFKTWLLGSKKNEIESVRALIELIFDGLVNVPMSIINLHIFLNINKGMQQLNSFLVYATQYPRISWSVSQD